ncbi:MAG: ABC transporter ATP-binding protein [Spirochaetes bacterium]|nr:ABC transporter ATP-binding protein [Spirochaetota bacterium]
MIDIVLKGVSKDFGKYLAVDTLDLTIKEHDFHTLLGPSGCGKTTTLRMVAGLEEPTSGDIFIGKHAVFSSKNLINVSPAKRNIALIFQDYALWPHMTVFDNIKFGLEVLHIKKNEVKRKISRILENVHLEGLEKRYPNELSGGQQQRVSMARMLVIEPKILMMDEPLSNLDAKLRSSMRSEIKRLHNNIGATTIYVTHDQEEAMALSDMITVMNNGKVQQTASPLELYDHPENIFVAGFVGNPPVNLLNGRVIKQGLQKVLINSDFLGQINIDNIQNVTLKKDQSVIIGIRPEDITLYSSNPDKNSAEATIITILPTGSETLVEIKLGDKIISAKVERHNSYEINTKVYLAFESHSIHLFDSESGRRLN